MPEPKRIGRPRVGPAIHIRLTAQQLAKLDAYRAQQRISRAEAIRRLVERYAS